MKRRKAGRGNREAIPENYTFSNWSFFPARFIDSLMKRGAIWQKGGPLSVETAGHFDMDAELKIYISSNPHPIKKEFKKGTDIVQLQKLLATYILSG